MKSRYVIACAKGIIRANKGKTAALLLVAVLGVLVSLAPPQIMRIIIDKYLLAKSTGGIYLPAILYLISIILIGALDFSRGYLLSFFGQRAIYELRFSMLKKLSRIKAGYFTENSAGFITSRINTDVDSVNTLFSEGLVSMAIDCMKLAGIVISIWLFSFRLGIIALLIIPVVFTVARFFRTRMFRAQSRNLEQLSGLNGHIAESVKIISMVKLFSKESYMEEKYRKQLKENYVIRGKVILYDSCYAPIIQLIRAIVIAAVILLSAGEIGVLGISAGMTAAAIDLFAALLLPVEALGMEIQNIQKGMSGIRRIDEFLELDEDEKDKSISTGAVLRGCEPFALRFEKMSFSYIEDVPVLKNIDLDIRKGESVTIAGRTGVGKSTLFGLIMGLLYPTGGRVLIGGFDACKIPDEEKRGVFGYVEQSFRFIPGTVAEQISLGDDRISRDRIREVCREVGLEESIEALPQGYDTPVTNGVVLSWGQCQLLSIARAVAAKPPILLLDEITANLDSATESAVMAAVRNVSRGRTVISISHRESAMKSCDRLILIENKEIYAQGRPDDIFDIVNVLDLK